MQTEMQSIITAAKEKNFRCFNDYSRELTFLLEISNTSTDLQWLQINPGSIEKDISDWIPLQNLQSLRLDEVSAASLWQRDDQIPLKLKELHIKIRFLLDSSSTNLLSLIGMLKHLETLHMEFWNRGRRPFHWNCLLTSLRKLTHLKTLTLKRLSEEFTFGNRGKTIDDDLSPMRCLEAITLSSNGLSTRKVSISGHVCPALKSLKLYSMKDVITVDLTEITTLECLVLLDCQGLTKVLCSGLVQLEMVRIRGCHAMSKLPNFGRFKCLKRIYIKHCQNLQDMSAIERLKGLKKISISNCQQLKNIKAIEQLKGLNRIWIEWCDQLKGVIGFKELKGLKRVFIGSCPWLEDIQGIESLICLESFIIAGCPKLQNITGIEELEGLKEMIVSDAPSITCIEKLQRLPELIILVGRLTEPFLDVDDEDEDEDEDSSSMPFLNADKIGNTLFMVDDFCETEHGYLRRQVVEMIHSFHIKTQHSFSTFIFCAMYEGPVFVKRDICNGTEIGLDGNCELKGITLCSDTYGEDWWIYMCAVNEERLSKYDSWMPTNYHVEKAFLMGVKKGEERKTLCILQSLFTQLGLGNGKYHEITELIDWLNVDIDDVDIDDLHEYDREDNDDDEYGDDYYDDEDDVEYYDDY